MASRSKKKHSRYKDFSHVIIPNTNIKPKKEYLTMSNSAKQVIPQLDTLKLKHISVMKSVESFIESNSLWHNYYPAIEEFVYVHSDSICVIIKELPDSSTFRFIVYEDKKGVTCMGVMNKLSLTYEYLDTLNPYAGVVSLLDCMNIPNLPTVKGFDLNLEAKNLFKYFNNIIQTYMHIASYFANHHDNNIIISHKSSHISTHNFIRHTDSWFRKGHWRTLPSGKQVWVKPTTCGDKTKQRSSKTYKIE